MYYRTQFMRNLKKWPADKMDEKSETIQIGDGSIGGFVLLQATVQI